MAKKADEARALFMTGCNCSQSVAGAFAGELGMPQEMVLRIISGFGGGMSRLREVCGAFSGVVLVVSTLYGSADPAKKTEVYTVVQELSRRFIAQNGSLSCKELLGLAKAEGSPVASERTREYYKKRPCADIVANAAAMLEAYMQENPPTNPPLALR